MSAVVYWMVWTYAALVAGWWVGRHWDCDVSCGRWCIDDREPDRPVANHGYWAGQRARDALRHADTVVGYPSSGRDVADLTSPPAGPGPGGSRP